MNKKDSIFTYEDFIAALVFVVGFFAGLALINDSEASGVSSVSKYNPTNVTITGGTINGVSIGQSASAPVEASSIKTLTYKLSNKISWSNISPTIGGGFGTGAAINNANGTAAFWLYIGSGGTATEGFITMPDIGASGWHCTLTPYTAITPNGVNIIGSIGATNITIKHVNITTGAPLAWTTSSIIGAHCIGY